MEKIGTRPVDKFGRIVLPDELRKSLCIQPADRLDIYRNGEVITMKRSVLTCVFCGGKEHLVSTHNTFACKECIGKLAELL